MDLNKVMMIGNVVSEPEAKTTPNGQNVTSFRMATNRRWKDKQTGELKEDSQFHNVVAWGALADVVSRYAGKGKKIYLEGRLTHRNYEQNGETKWWTEIVAENIILLGAPGNGGAVGGANTGTASSSGANNSSSVGNQANSNTDNSAPVNEDVNIPAPEEIPTIDIDDDKEEIKVEDIPF